MENARNLSVCGRSKRSSLLTVVSLDCMHWCNERIYYQILTKLGRILHTNVSLNTIEHEPRASITSRVMALWFLKISWKWCVFYGLWRFWLYVCKGIDVTPVNLHVENSLTGRSLSHIIPWITVNLGRRLGRSWSRGACKKSFPVGMNQPGMRPGGTCCQAILRCRCVGGMAGVPGSGGACIPVCPVIRPGWRGKVCGRKLRDCFPWKGFCCRCVGVTGFNFCLGRGRHQRWLATMVTPIYQCLRAHGKAAYIAGIANSSQSLWGAILWLCLLFSWVSLCWCL